MKYIVKGLDVGEYGLHDFPVEDPECVGVAVNFNVGPTEVEGARFSIVCLHAKMVDESIFKWR